MTDMSSPETDQVQTPDSTDEVAATRSRRRRHAPTAADLELAEAMSSVSSTEGERRSVAEEPAEELL